MDTQNQIKRTLAQPDAIETIRQLQNDSTHKTRAAFARAVCQHFGFYDARQHLQVAGCAKALRELERAEHFALLPVNKRSHLLRRTPSPQRLNTPVPNPVEVPAQAGAVCGLTLIQVKTDEQMRVWNELMLCEHPQGAGPLVGAQMRYLIGSEHGWLGGLGFGAAALQLADRDQWIGWDSDTRRKYLFRVVGMSRFLIRTTVHCQNLASRVLGMVLRRLGDDYEAQYHYRPWLVESFVDTDQFTGTCYQAANWVAIGQTRGRGRQDRKHLRVKSIKAIYAYVLDSGFRAKMGVAEPVGLVSLEIAEGLDGGQWADQEFGGAQLGDQRLSERLVESARLLGAMPGRAFCGVAQGNWPAIKGYYRMIDQPDDAGVTMEAILAPHRGRTIQRMKGQSTVLCIQDGTDLNYSGLAQSEGLGVIGSNQTGTDSPGLHLHSTLVVSTAGLPLGLLNAQCSAPTPRQKGQPAASLPIEEKKTFAWIQGLRDCVAVAANLPDTRQVCVMDREADFYALFDEQHQKRKVDLLIRAKHNRATTEDLSLFESVRQSPVRGILRIPVPRQSARPKRYKQKAREERAARTAEVALRYHQITLRPPTGHPAKKPVSLWVVHIVERSPPDGVKPLEWFLLTTCEIATADQAHECLRWYCLRWRIEDWHRVLKSGCRIEELQHKTAERLKRAIAINLVMAWRIMLMTLLGRECPDLPASILFTDIEIDVLTAYAKKNGLPDPRTSAMPSALSHASAGI